MRLPEAPTYRGTADPLRPVLALVAIGAMSAALVVAAHPATAGVGPTSDPTAVSADATAFAGAKSSIEVHGRGNGHGHGMSQYGAQGAAMAGLSSREIVAFYYPGSTLTTLAPSTVRVSISAAGSWTTVFAGTPGMRVTQYGALPTSGYTRFRLRPYGSGLALGGLRTSGAWDGLATNLPSRADFSSAAGFVRLQLSDATSTRYRGTVGAVRNGSGELTINRVSLDGYAMGVAPREMPSSWRPAAVGAQAIAARTYGRNAVESHGGSRYDICDTTWCQVYGGMTHFSSGGSVLWNDYPAAVQGNENKVLRYNGNTIFAQFSASNGGAMLSGGQPYLRDKADPYDNASTGDPYLGWSDTVTASSVASYYGMSSVSSIQVTKRNGYGTWGGWVLSATVRGTSSSGSAKRVSTSGTSLANAMGVRTSYFHFDDEVVPAGAPLHLTAANGDAGAKVSWAAPTNASAAQISGYRVHFGDYSFEVPAGARSAYVSPIKQDAGQYVWVRAINPLGYGALASVTVRGRPAPAGVVPIATGRLFDSQQRQPSVDHAHPYRVDLRGRGSLPTSGMTSVQLALTVLHVSGSGTLSVYVDGSPAAPAATVPYRDGRMITTTLSLPTRPSATLRFVPSAGSVDLMAAQQSYTASWGRNARPVPPTLVRTVNHVAQNGSTVISLDGAPGITVNTKAVLVSVQAWAGADRAALWVWPDDQPQPQVVHVAAAPWGPSANTVLVRLPASHRLRLATNKAGVGARVTLLGLVGNGGSGFESFPPNAIAADSMPAHPSRWVGPDLRTQQLTGLGQVPSSGVNAVLVRFVVTATHEAGKLYAWPSDAERPAGAHVFVAKGEMQTGTALLKLGPSGAIKLQASTPGLHVMIHALGYLSPES